MGWIRRLTPDDDLDWTSPGSGLSLKSVRLLLLSPLERSSLDRDRGRRTDSVDSSDVADANGELDDPDPDAGGESDVPEAEDGEPVPT